MTLVPVLLIEKLMLPAAADVALISQLVSAAFTEIGPGAPGAEEGAVLVQPARATAAMVAAPAMRGVRDMRGSPSERWSP